MAKAKRAPDIGHFAEPDEWAAEVLRLRFAEVLSFTGAALAPSNVDGVHDMRVALRRLRSALRDFVEVIDEKPLKRIAKELKKNAEALGVVRDHDVAVIALEQMSSATHDDLIKTGIGELADEIRKERETAYRKMKKTFSVRSMEDLRERFVKRVNDAVRQQSLFRPTTLGETAREVIEDRLQDFLKKGDTIYDPFEGEKLHTLRLAAKRLRYAIELFAGCLKNDAAAVAKNISKLQSFLGEVHDCDVWIDRLNRRLIEKGRKAEPKSPSATATAWLLAKFKEIRSKEYGSALDQWQAWTANSFVDRIREVLR